MIRFRRNTHDALGHARTFSKKAELAFTKYGFAAHMLDPDIPMTFDEYVAKWRQYEADNNDAPYSAYGVLNALRHMVKHGFVLIEEGP